MIFIACVDRWISCLKQANIRVATTKFGGWNRLLLAFVSSFVHSFIYLLSFLLIHSVKHAKVKGRKRKSVESKEPDFICYFAVRLFFSSIVSYWLLFFYFFLSKDDLKQFKVAIFQIFYDITRQNFQEIECDFAFSGWRPWYIPVLICATILNLILNDAWCMLWYHQMWNKYFLVLNYAIVCDHNGFIFYSLF